MIAILTGDIINSEHYNVSDWMSILKEYFSQLGSTPQVWEIYRGDEFQIKVAAVDALEVAIAIKAKIKTIKGLDVRMGIGLGEEDFVGASVSESNGTAYQFSGRIFEKLKDQKLNLALASSSAKFDTTLNLILKLALDFMDDWSPVSAEIIAISLAHPDMPQQEIADQLGIQQSAVSQRQKRARLDLVQQVLTYYKATINK
ncbi:sigma factor-like helix-turn-helix DNA-binding protein [Cellulophaga tyrosinoxydans]|uniref:SatD family (SatD) n=1 Tax=Cellulophaga tyrosinoxydans TaxID=504486 RepID=A0A1W2CLY9_9FLAO|nr:sigma factor-like helix-turn-helix DNA-binding protein [Cellulophaga tyrosinoxydans]SMC86026.1 SatD family (SatD) [Cellulophaga tyrosinoxydans]